MPSSDFIFQLVATGDVPDTVRTCAQVLNGVRSHSSLQASVLQDADGVLVVRVLSRDPNHHLRVVQAECRLRFNGTAVEIFVPFERNEPGAYTNLVFDLWVAFVLATTMASSWGSLVRVRKASWPESDKSVGIFSGDTADHAFADAIRPMGFPADLKNPTYVESFASAASRFMPEPSPWARNPPGSPVQATT